MSIQEVSADEAVELVRDGALLLDVRNDDEWSAGHAPEATYITMGAVPDRLAELPRDRTIVTVCRSGGRSARVTEFLAAQGFHVVNVFGGMKAWAASGNAVVADDGREGAVI